MLFIVKRLRALFNADGKAKAQRLSSKTAQLSAHQHYRLEKVIPTAQLALAQQYFIPCLALVYDLLNRIVLDKQSRRTLFDEKYEAILALFQRMQQHTLFIQPPVSQRSLNNVIACFVFYRTLFQGVLDKAIEAGVVDKDVDRFIFHKRIPTQLLTALGAQVWRCYELQTVVFGQLDDLVLNADIQAILIDLCPKEKTLKTKQSVVSAESVQTVEQLDTHDKQSVGDVSDEPIDTPIDDKLCENEINRQNNNAVDAEEASSGDKRDIKTPPPDSVHTPDESVTREQRVVPIANDQSDEHAAFKNKFNKWLIRHSKRYPVNHHTRLWVDVTQFGAALVFVSDIALSDFARKDQRGLDELKSLLQATGLASEKQYVWRCEGQAEVSLIAVSIDFTIEMTQPMTGTISEVSS